jgi:hypothetical protein
MRRKRLILSANYISRDVFIRRGQQAISSQVVDGGETIDSS